MATRKLARWRELGIDRSRILRQREAAARDAAMRGFVADLALLLDG